MDTLTSAYDFVGLEHRADDDNTTGEPARINAASSTFDVSSVYDGRGAYDAVYEAVAR